MSTSITDAQKQLVSVVIPVYNAEGTLDECLDSIEGQTHRDLEIVCVNDGSTDGSAQIMRAHAARDPRIVIVDKPNEGYGASCNRGIDVSRGAWVAIVEPDDTLEPTCYEELLACAARYGGEKNVDVVKAAYWRVFPGENGAGELRVSCPYHGRVRPRRQPFAVGEGVELLRHHPAIWAGMYRRGYLLEQRIRFVEVPGAGWADNPFLAETLCHTDRIAYTDARVYDYRERDLNEAESFAGRSPLTPLERWNDMMDAAERAGEKDPRVLSALALRGVNYALITVQGAGLDAPGVRELVTSSMGRLDAKAVLADPTISPSGKRLFAEARGLPAPRGGRLGYLAHLAGEALYRVRENGLGFALRTARSRREGNRLG
ncbi:glycosyltransferase [Olsenella profusa]|uniref:Glycosyltransferase n=1 Tax=Olsenella profusa TaxID=138595 RepID=A0ABS2F0W6_9ACTN|nr:glycosyltransferase [Olsenella profusa]MBM6774616.1 glycosyltransferase [Olsenella profusa]